MMGATGGSDFADFEVSNAADFADLGVSNAVGAGLEMATNRADGVRGIGGGEGIFLPGDPVPAGGWLVGAFPAVCWLVLALASGELATVVPGTFAEGAFGSIEILGSLAGGALDPLGERVGVSVVILVVTSQVEDGPVSCSWGTEESCFVVEIEL